MRSNEIAEISGVSVRTLRHYHQIGLLAEPSRQANGYRVYEMAHLIRLLRIGQLAALGMRLSDIPAALDRDDSTQASSLDELDRKLKKQIELLKRQRRTLAALRGNKGPLDMPPELAASLTSMETGRATAATKAGREQAVLFGHVFDERERTVIAGLYDRLAEPELARIAGDLGRQFDALGSDTSEQAIYDLADAYVEHLGPWLRDFQQVVDRSARGDAGALLCQHAAGASNPQQQMMMAKVSAILRDKPR